MVARMATKGTNFHSLHGLRESGASTPWKPPPATWRPWRPPGLPSSYADLPTATGPIGSPGRLIRYRPGIDGLRALAVVAVLLYHAGAKLAPGGFLGVDLFFVISGFLITTLLIE